MHIWGNLWQRWAGGGGNERMSRQAAGRLMSDAGGLMPVKGNADSIHLLRRPLNRGKENSRESPAVVKYDFYSMPCWRHQIAMTHRTGSSLTSRTWRRTGAPKMETVFFRRRSRRVWAATASGVYQRST